jgi:hypothetical protein
MGRGKRDRNHSLCQNNLNRIQREMKRTDTQSGHQQNKDK